MPIRFTCTHCSQHLSAASRKAGHEVTCPKCQGTVHVPKQEPSPSEAVPPPPHSGPPEKFGELIYDSADDEAPDADNQHLVLVPRRVLYIQGFLLGAVALTFFVFWLIVGNRSATDSRGARLRQPCIVSGTVEFRNGANDAIPDEGTVVVLLPSETRPDQKVMPDGLRPQDMIPDNDHPGLTTVRQWGGSFSRVDHRGKFRLQAPTTGRYYLLFVSANTMRSESEQPESRDLAQIGRYFLPASEFLGKHRYDWREVRVLEDQRINVTF